MTAIRVLGGGVSGVTTGIVLRLLGYDVSITAQAVMAGDGAALGDPTFASMFPPASIIPHTRVDHEEWQAATALRVFDALRSEPGAGVRRQRHFDLFERPEAAPPYARRLHGFEELVGGTDDPAVPRRTGCGRVWGWAFDCLFADMPTYRRWLLDLYSGLGGRFARSRHVTLDDLPRFPEPVVVDCTGFGSGDLFGTGPELTLVKGIQVMVPATGLDLPPCSYSYTPHPSVHPANVSFYPRADSWLLGGTRWPGTLDHQGRWVGEGPSGPTVTIDGIEVPAAIVDLNRDLVRTLTGVDIAGRRLRATVGYRCRRRAALGGLRIEAEPIAGKVVVHNYAHAGVGVALSWGSALRVARMVAAAGDRPDRPDRRGCDPGPAAGRLAEVLAELLPGAPG